MCPLLWLPCLIIGLSEIADTSKSCITCLYFSFHCRRAVMAALSLHAVTYILHSLCSRVKLAYYMNQCINLVPLESSQHSFCVSQWVELLQILFFWLVLLLHLGHGSKWSLASCQGSPLGSPLLNLSSTHCHSWLWASHAQLCSLLSLKGQSNLFLYMWRCWPDPEPLYHILWSRMPIPSVT